MAIEMYLAMTAAEFSTCEQFPERVAWLACHFSSSGPGLSNIPKSLPAHSLLMVDDSTPFQNHEPECIIRQLREAVSALEAQAVILDFQRPYDGDLQALVLKLQNELPFPVAVPPEYAQGDCPVFLPTCPLNKPLKNHLAPYQGRSVWLDISPLPARITVTPRGSHYEVLKDISNTLHWESNLHCHYNIDIEDERIVFTLARDFESWLTEAEKLGVSAAIGLYQEFRK